MCKIKAASTAARRYAKACAQASARSGPRDKERAQHVSRTDSGAILRVRRPKRRQLLAPTDLGRVYRSQTGRTRRFVIAHRNQVHVFLRTFVYQIQNVANQPMVMSLGLASVNSLSTTNKLTA